MKVTVTFPEIVETYDLGDRFTMEEFLEDPEMALDVFVSDVNHEYDWEIEEENA
jgi:hypothetical protein